GREGGPAGRRGEAGHPAFGPVGNRPAQAVHDPQVSDAMQEENSAIADELRRLVRDVPDYPKPGIVFKDITPVLGHARLFARACEVMAAPYAATRVSHVVAIESRGF